METKILKVLETLKLTDMLITEAHKAIMDIVNPKKTVNESNTGIAPIGTQDVCHLCKYHGFCTPDVFETCVKELTEYQYYK